MLTYIDKLQNENPNVTIIGTTNLSTKNTNLDGAAISRFQNLIEVPYPDEKCLYEALIMNLSKIKNIDNFIVENEENLRKLSKTMADRKFSFRNLENIINEAKVLYLEERMDKKSDRFKFNYLENAQKLLQKTDGEIETLNSSKKTL